MGRISADRMTEMYGDAYYGEGRRGGAERRRARLSPSQDGEVDGGRRTRACRRGHAQALGSLAATQGAAAVGATAGLAR